MMVEILESTFVVPAKQTPTETLMLSNLDLVAVRKHNCNIYLYRKTEGAADFVSAEVLKSALAKTLVTLYPLAGRHFVGADGRDRIDCNAKGILFVVARSARTADSIQFEPMTPELREHFIPEEQPSFLLMLQVTYLKCGSVVLGTSFNHILIDGRSASVFYDIWSRIAQGDDFSSIVPPSFDNTPLRARSPPKISTDFPEYTTDQLPKKSNTPDSCVQSLLRLSKDQISRLKHRCSKTSKYTYISTFSAVSALVWRCYCVAQGLSPDTESRLYFTADIRNRIHPPLKDFFGNAVIRTSAASEVSNITSNPIGSVAGILKATTDALTNEYIRSFIDFVEVLWSRKLSVRPITEADLRIRTVLGMAVTDLDFGCGAMQLLSWERYTEDKVIYIMNEPGRTGGVKIVPSLEASTMERFKKAFYQELSSCEEAT